MRIGDAFARMEAGVTRGTPAHLTSSRLLKKCSGSLRLRAGVLEDGQRTRSDAGTVQGGSMARHLIARQPERVRIVGTHAPRPSPAILMESPVDGVLEVRVLHDVAVADLQ